MANKAQPKPAPAAAPDSAAGELAALNPDVTLQIAGRELTVREYRVFEGLEVAARAADFIADLVECCRDGSLEYARVRPLFGRHSEAVADIVARSADVEPDWVRGLDKREDLEALLSVWFGVNAGFFVHEVVVALRQERLREAMEQGGSTSSPASPKPGSATSTGSAN